MPEDWGSISVLGNTWRLKVWFLFGVPKLIWMGAGKSLNKEDMCVEMRYLNAGNYNWLASYIRVTSQQTVLKKVTEVSSKYVWIGSFLILWFLSTFHTGCLLYQLSGEIDHQYSSFHTWSCKLIKKIEKIPKYVHIIWKSFSF